MMRWRLYRLIGAVIMMPVLFLGWLGMRTIIEGLASRGLKVKPLSCVVEGSRYVARCSILNTEDGHKVVAIQTIFHLMPPKGEAWPNNKLRNRYSTNSEWAVTSIDPQETKEVVSEMIAYGVNGYHCQVDARVSKQQRFNEQPSSAAIFQAERKLDQESKWFRRRWRN